MRAVSLTVGTLAAVWLAACASTGTRPGTLGTALVVGTIAGGIVAGGDEDGSVGFDNRLVTAVAIATIIAQKLEKVAADCARTRAEARIDCLGEGYARAGAGIPDDATFGDARAAVARAAAQLSGLAAANRDEDAAEVAAPGAARPLKPVSPEKLAAAQARAAQIVEEAQTVLLRSSESSPSRAPYEKIAAALDSGKVLMRS